MAISETIILRFAGAAVMTGLRAVQRSFRWMAREGGSALKSLFSPLAKLAAMLGPVAIAAGLFKIGSGASQAAAEIETLTAQYSALLQSGEKGRTLMEGIRKINEESVLTLPDMAEGATLMLANNATVEETIDVLERLGKMSLGSADRMNRLVTAYSQVKGMGKLQAQDKNQFVAVGWNPLQELSQATGQSIAELSKLMEDGAISFDHLAFAMKRATGEGGKFYLMNEEMMKTTGGKWSMLSDAWGRLMVTMGSPINDHLRPLLDELTVKLKTLGPMAAAIGTRVGEYMTALRNAFSSGDLGELLSESFKLPLKMIAAEMIALFDYIGGQLVHKIRLGLPESLKSASDRQYADFGLQPRPYANSRVAAYNMLGVEKTKERLGDIVEKNQKPTMTAFVTDSTWEQGVKAVTASLSRIESKLSAHP